MPTLTLNNLFRKLANLSSTNITASDNTGMTQTDALAWATSNRCLVDVKHHLKCTNETVSAASRDGSDDPPPAYVKVNGKVWWDAEVKTWEVMESGFDSECDSWGLLETTARFDDAGS